MLLPKPTSPQAPKLIGVPKKHSKYLDQGWSAGGRSVPVKVVNSQGCLDKAPGQPKNVTAKAMSGGLIVSWAPPDDGSCIDTYVLDVIDPALRSAVPVQSTSTDTTEATFSGLTNDKEYNVSVTAYNGATRQTGTADVLAAPTDKCAAVAPGKPTGFKVTPGSGMATLCWTGVANSACVDEYRVSAENMFRSSSMDGPSVSKGGCANISRLTNDQAYTFSVVAFAKDFGQGPASTATATVGASKQSQNGWRCKPMAGCRPSTSLTVCSLMTCQGMSSWGGCKGLGAFDVNFATRQMTQWCQGVCACDLSIVSSLNPVTYGLATGFVNGLGALIPGVGGPYTGAPSPTLSSAEIGAQLQAQSSVLGAQDPEAKSMTPQLGSGYLIKTTAQNFASSGTVGTTLANAIGGAINTGAKAIGYSIGGALKNEGAAVAVTSGFNAAGNVVANSASAFTSQAVNSLVQGAVGFATNKVPRTSLPAVLAQSAGNTP